jgi:hypothetical protein
MHYNPLGKRGGMIGILPNAFKHIASQDASSGRRVGENAAIVLTYCAAEG